MSTNSNNETISSAQNPLLIKSHHISLETTTKIPNFSNFVKAFTKIFQIVSNSNPFPILLDPFQTPKYLS